MLKRILLYYILVLLLVTPTLISCSNENTNAIANINQEQEIQSPILFAGINDYWQLADTDQIAGIETKTFLPSNETMEDWTEKITVTSFNNSSSAVSLYDYYNENVWAFLKDECYFSTPSLTILNKSSNELIYSYAMHECGKNPDQVVYGRIIRISNNIYAISYTVNGGQVNSVYAQDIYNLISKSVVLKSSN